MSAESTQELHSTLVRLPPGPWHADGDMVKAGQTVVCVIPHGHHSGFVAQQIARLPTLLTETVAREELDEVERQLREAEKKIAELESELEDVLN